MLLQRVELDGDVVDVRVAGGRVAAIAPRLERSGDERCIEGAGGALLPGLHDHHIHVMALAAAMASVACGPSEVAGPAALTAALREALPGADGWVRAVGYHERVAGALDRHRLDEIRADVPLRVQHRSGALWTVNSLGLSLLCDDGRGTPAPAGAERDAAGALTGRFFREDGWLRERLPTTPGPDLAPVGALLGRFGVTGLTDATPTNGPAEQARFGAAEAAGDLPQDARLMGGAALAAPAHWKIIVDERELPTPDALAERLAAARAAGRPVAVHCVTRAELAVTCAALETVGPRPGDRIEHAAVAPPELVAWMARLGVGVVTQPHFIRERGDSYREEVEARDQPWLYRCAGFLEAGLRLGGGTDAPYGAPDPWQAMAAAVDRRTAAGVAMAEAEALHPERALALFTSAPDDPGGPARRVVRGGPADLCLLRVPWRVARDRLSADDVACTLRTGRVLFSAAAAAFPPS